MKKRNIFVYILVFTGFLLNEWILALFSEDGELARQTILKIRVFNVASITVGILFFFRSFVKRNFPTLLVFLFSIIFSVYLADNLLYFCAPYFPYNFSRMLSSTAQERFVNINDYEIPWVYDTNIRYFEANPKNNTHHTDELGYRNPRGYLKQVDKKIDVLLLGDSFTWGTEDKVIAEYLREILSKVTVYSLGMGGEGIPQWRYHFERFVSETGIFPKLVVFNFYPGNDIADTRRFLQVKKKFGKMNSFIYFQGGVPPSRLKIFYQVPEVVSLAKSLLLKKKLSKLTTIKGLPGQYDIRFWEREPMLEEINDEVLEQIKNNIEMIRRLSPDTKLLFSYLPCASDLYGDRTEPAAKYAEDIKRQKVNSEYLKKYAEKQNMTFFDSVESLRVQALDKMIWVQAHFNQEGYRIYSEMLAEEIKSCLN